MKEVYLCPQVDVICFAPAKRIAYNPDWGFEEDVFSDGEVKGWSDADAERRGRYES